MVLPQIAFCANYEENIKSVIFNAMDCKLECNRRFNTELRWFKGYPEFTLKRHPSFHDKSKLELSRDHGKWFEMNIDRINNLYTLIHGLFPDGKFINYNKNEYDITIHQIFSLGKDVWTDVDQQSVFHCPTPVLPENYLPWAEAATHHDYTYMMSDSANTYKAGRASEENLAKLKEGLDIKVCTLWYNFILGRIRTRPQDGSFGDHTKVNWNTLEEAYKEFRIMPTHHGYIESGKDPVNTPCTGFPPHPKKIGWKEGDWNMEHMYSNSRALTEEEYWEQEVTMFKNTYQGNTHILHEEIYISRKDVDTYLAKSIDTGDITVTYALASH